MYSYGFINYFSTEGRLCRRQYIAVLLTCTVITTIFMVFLIAAGVNESFVNILLFLLGLTFIPTSVKRLHDLNKSGWLYLIAYVPIINLLFGLCLLTVPGTKGKNDYGDDPHLLEK